MKKKQVRLMAQVVGVLVIASMIVTLIMPLFSWLATQGALEEQRAAATATVEALMNELETTEGEVGTPEAGGEAEDSGDSGEGEEAANGEEATPEEEEEEAAEGEEEEATPGAGE